MSLLIGKHIKKIITDNVKELEGRIYPLVVVSGTPKFPMAIYQNNESSVDYTKDGSDTDTVHETINVFAKSYDEAVMIAQKVRYAFDGNRMEHEELRVVDSIVTSYTEDYVDAIEVYMIRINVQFKTIDK